ncbi:MAG: nucleotide sugar dehydrogenase [Candidatus Omnitrophica bacterium]|nr:nucleotide sugar dehydrogenase [Candidatus Omnitrophota bacterium]
MARILYQQIVPEVVTVSSPKTAEMVKLLENTFRSVNIGMVNELALMCNRLKVDVWEVIDAAATKPFGFMPFYPGPGIGGHCIPLDPIYLSWKAKLHGSEARFIDLADQVNSRMPEYAVERVKDTLNGRGKAIYGSKILLVGVAYKKDVCDTRESPALEIIHHLKENGADISYYDPYVPVLKIEDSKFNSIKLTGVNIRKQDAVLIVTNHSNIDYRFILDNARFILDTRNALKSLSPGRCKVVKL